MEYADSVVLVGAILLAIGVQPLQVWIHEMGHFVAALCVSRERVSLQLGDEVAALWKYEGQRVSMRFSRQWWRYGMVSCSVSTRSKTAVVLLAGPLASLVALGIALVAIQSSSNIWVQLSLVPQVLMAAKVGLLALSPRPILDRATGRVIPTDGSQLRRLWRHSASRLRFT